jgi:hypothetical protein
MTSGCEDFSSDKEKCTTNVTILFFIKVNMKHKNLQLVSLPAIYFSISFQPEIQQLKSLQNEGAAK